MVLKWTQAAHGAYRVGATGEYSKSPPLDSLTAVMRMVVVTWLPASDCSCSKVQIRPFSTCVAYAHHMVSDHVPLGHEACEGLPHPSHFQSNQALGKVGLGGGGWRGGDPTDSAIPALHRSCFWLYCLGLRKDRIMPVSTCAHAAQVLLLLSLSYAVWHLSFACVLLVLCPERVQGF